MAAPTLSAATITQESGKFGWTDVNFDHGVSIKEISDSADGTECFFDTTAKKITMNGSTSGTFGAFYEIEITVPFHFSGLKGNIVVNKEASSGSGPDNYYYPTDLTTWNQSYHEIFVDVNQGGMFTGSEYQIIANSAGYSSGTILNGGAQNNTTFTQTYTQTTGMKPTNIIRIRMYQDHARHWSITASDFNIQALPDVSFPIVQMAFSAAIANNANVNADDFSLKIHGESTPIGKVLTDSGNVLLLPGVDKRSPLVTNSPILSSALASGNIELTFNSNIKDVATYNAGDFIVTDSTTTVTIAPSVASNKLVLTPSGHTFSNLTNVRIVYTRHATANRNLLYTDDTAIESFDLLLDNNLSAVNRTKAIEVTYTKHGAASRNIANASAAAVASFSNNNDNTAAPTLSTMTIGDEGNRMGGWRKLDYTGGVKITELADYTGGSSCTFDKTKNTISMSGTTSGTLGALYQIDITVPYKITGLRGQLSVKGDSTDTGAKPDDYHYPEDLTTWAQSYHEIIRDSLKGSWVVGTDKQIIARVGGTNGSGVLSTPSKGDGYGDIPLTAPILLKYVQTTSMTSTNVVRIRVYQTHSRFWTLKELKLEVLPDPSLKLIELNFSDTVYFGSNTKKDIFSVKKGNESVEVVDAKSVGSKILLLTGGGFTHVDQANIEYYNDKFSSIAANGNNLDITLSNNVLITDDIDNDITLRTTSGTKINVDTGISSGKLSLTKKGNIDLTSDHSPLRSNFAYSHSTSTTITNEAYKVARSFDVSKYTQGYYTADNEYNASTGAYTGSTTTSGYAGQWFQIDVGVPTIVTKIEVYVNSASVNSFKDYRIFGSSDNSTFTQILNVTSGPNEMNFYNYNISGASSARYYRIVVNKNHGHARIIHSGYFKFIGIPDSSVSFPDTNYTVEYNQSNIDKLVKTSDVNISIPSFKIVNGVDNTFQMRNISGNTIGSFTKNNGDSGTPSCSSVSIASESSSMGGWRKLDYTGGVKITELANVAANGSVCVFDYTTNTISMNGSTNGIFGAFYQIDITVPYKITGLRGQLSVQGDRSGSEPDDYYYPEDLTTWAQSFHKINLDEVTGSWVVGTDKQIIARVGGTNGSGVLSTPSRGDGKGDIPYKIPILLKYAQTTSMTSTNVVRIHVYQDHARHWTLKELQLEVLPDTNLKIVELNFSSNVTINSSLKKDIISLKRGGEKINIIDIKESTSKALLLTDGVFEHANEIDIQYYQDKVSNVSVDSNNLKLTFTNNIISKESLNYRDFTVTNFDGFVIPIKPTISSGKLVISKSNLEMSQYIDLTSPDSIFKNDFVHTSSSYYSFIDETYTPSALFRLTGSYTFISGKDDYSGTNAAYAGTVTTNGYGGQWCQIDIGRQVTVRLIKFKIGDNATYPKEVKVFGSNDDSSWTEIAQINYQGEAMLTEQEMFTLTAASYRYYRFVAGKLQGSSADTHVYFDDYYQLLGLPEGSTFTNTKYKIEYNKNGVTKDENLLRNSDPTIPVPSFKIIGGIDCTTTISNYKGTSVSSFNQNSGDSAAPSFHSAAIVNENSKFGWQKVTMGVPTITIVEKTDNETMVWDNTAKTATMSGSTSSAFGSVIQLDFTAPCYFVGLRGQFKMESLTTNYADDYYYPETLSTWNQAKTAISPNSNYGANLLGSDKQIIARVGGTDGNARLNASAISRGDGAADIPQNNPIFIKYVQTTSMTETNIIRIKIYQDSRNQYKLSDLQLEVLPATTYKIVELTFTENMVNKDFDGTDFDIKGVGEVGNIYNALTNSGKVYLLPSVRVPVINSLNLKYRANTFSSIAAVAGNLDITFSNDVAVSGSLNGDDFTVKDPNGYTISVTPTINSNKVRLTKVGNVKFSHDNSFNQIITASGIVQVSSDHYYPALAFDGIISGTNYGWSSTGSMYSSGTYVGANTTGGYNGDWIQIDIGTTVVLDNLKIYPGRNSVTYNPKSMRLFYSSNGTTWTQGADWTNLTAADDWYPSSTWTPVTKTGLALSGRYFRLAINESLGGTYIQIFEIELYGFVGSTSFTSTDGTVIYTKSNKASENIVNASDSSQAIGSFTLFNGSEDLTGHLTDVAGNTQPAFNVISADSTAPTISSSSLSGANLTLAFSEDIYSKDTYNTADFDVQLSGESMTVNSLSISSGDIVLALASTPSSSNALRVVYTKHATSNRNIVDSAGNAVANFTHIPSNDSTPPTFAGISIGGAHTGTGLIESVVTKAESDYAPSYSSIALASGNIEVTFSANVANTGDTSNYTIKQGGTVKYPSFSISGGKLVITPGYSIDVSAYDVASSASSVSGQAYTSSSQLNSSYAGSKVFDNSTGAWISHNRYSSGAYTGSESTEGYAGEWVQVDIGQNVLLKSYEIDPRTGGEDAHPEDMRFFYSSNGTNWTQLRDWTGLTKADDWYPSSTWTSQGPYTTQTIARYFRLVVNKKGTSQGWVHLGEIKLLGVLHTSETTADTFTTLSNIEVDYAKGTGSDNLRDSNGFDVPSFEITNNVNTTGVVPEYSSIGLSSGSVEVTFNKTLVDPGSLNSSDFHVTYNGSVTSIKPSISSGKLSLAGVIGLNTTSYDISSSDSTLSDQAYTAVSSYNANYTPDNAFDTNLTGDSNQRWASPNMTGTTTIDSSSVSGPWLQVDIGQNVLVDKFTIYYIATGQEIKSAKIAASTDGSTWTEIHAITDRAHNTNVTETYNISNANYQVARYYRIVVTAVQSSTLSTINEWTLFGVTQSQTSAATSFTSTSNLIVDYMKHASTTTRRLQNADGDEVASFEITNGVLSNDQEKPTFSNVTVASGKLELTFSENIAAASTLNVADFSVTDSGTNKPLQTPTISSGKLLIARDEYSLNGVTPYDLVSSSSALSGQTYSAFTTMGGYATSKAFDGTTTGSTNAWISNSGYSSGNFSGSETTDGYSGAWLQVDVGQDILMTSYEIYPRPAGDTHHTKDMRLYYSDDGSNWTQLREWTGLTLADDWKVGGSYTSLGPYTVSNIKGRYFRIVANKLFSSGQYVQIGEFKILGITVAQAAALAFANTNVTIKYTKHDDASRHLIRVNDPSDAVDGFTITNGFDNTPAAVASKDGILIDLDQNIASSSGYAAGNFAVTEGSVSKSVRAVKITPDNKVFLSMLVDINKMSDTNITYTPSGTPSENLETSAAAKTLAFTITNGSDATTRTNDRIVLNFSEDIVSKTTYSPDDFKILDSVTKTSTTTFASIAVASGKLELSFNNNVAVTGALERDDFKLEDTSGNAVGFLPPTISSGKVAIEKDESIDVASTNSTLSGQTYSESSKYSTSGANLAFDNEFTTTGGGHNNHWHSSGTGTHYNTGSTHNYIGSGNHSTTVSSSAIAGEWIQVDIGQSITLVKFIVEPSRTWNVRNPRKFTLAGSTNGSTWTLIRTVSGLEATAWYDGTTWSNNGPHYNVYTGRYFRLIVEETINEIYTTVGELRLFGYTSASSFTNTNYVIEYTKHATAGRNIVKSGATSDAIDTFRIDSGSETGLLKKVAEIGVVGGDVQLKTPIKSDNQTSIDIASSASTLTGTRAYTSSSFYNGTYPAADAFDNNNTGNTNSWISGNNTYSSGNYPGSNSTDGYDGEWVQVDVGTTVILTSYEIYPRANGDTRHPKDMRLFSSTDGTNWTQVQDWTNLTLADDWKVGGSYTSVGPYSTSTYGRYFRIATNKVLGGNYTQIGELRLLGYSATTDSLSSDAGLFEITYTNPGIQGRNLVDLAGNVVQTFTGRDRPAFGSATLTTTRIAQVTFSVALKDMSPLKTDFDVKLNGTSTSIESVSISGGKLIINLVRTMTPHSDAFPAVLTLDYTKNSSSTYNLRDAGDSAVESFVNKSINNPTSDTEPPVFVGAEIFDDEPTKVVLNFDFAVTISSPNVSVFQVKVNGSAVTISSVAIISGDIVLTLASAVSHTNTITVSYTKDGSDANKNIKDVSSNILETPLKSEHGTVVVKVASTKFTLEGESQKEIYLVKGLTYIFDLSDSTVASHAFKLSTTSNGSHNSGSEYTTGVTHAGTAGSAGAKLTFVVPNSALATLYYYCSTNSGIGGKINVSADAHTPVVNSLVATAVKSFKSDVQAGGIRDGIVAKRWSRFRTDKSKLTSAQRKYYGKDYFRSNPSAKIFKIVDEQNGQSIAFLKPAATGDPGAAQELDLDENEAEISFDNVTAEQSSLLSFTFDPQRNGSTTNTVQIKILFVKRINGDVGKYTYTLNGYTGNGIYSGKVVLVPAFSGGGTTGLITVTDMTTDTQQTINCDMTIEYTSSPGTTVEYTKSFTFFARNPSGGYSNDNTSTAGDPYIKTVNGQFYKLRDIPHKSVILYDNNNSERRIQLHAYLEPNVNYKKQINGYDDTLVSQMGERPINPAFFSKLWIRNREQEYFIDLETWIETKTGKNIIDLFNVDFAIETCKFHVYLSEKCVTVKLPVEDNFFIIIKRFINPEIRTGIELSIPTWMSSPLAYGALLYPGETNDLFIDKIDDKSIKRKARKLENMSTVRENFANPETGSVKVVDWKY
jgi:uncharacterized repeat protein (TIGR02059 family)